MKPRRRNAEILIEIRTFLLKSAFKNIVCKMAAILSRPQCVKLSIPIKLQGTLLPILYNWNYGMYMYQYYKAMYEMWLFPHAHIYALGNGK